MSRVFTFDFFKWFYPGMHIKRWLALIVIGVAIMTFGLGYVELPGALRVESRLLESNPNKLSIGSEMQLVLYTHRVDPDGTRILNYAFEPVGTAS